MLQSREISRYSMSIIEFVKPYLYRRRRNAFIRPLSSADNSPPQAGSV